MSPEITDSNLSHLITFSELEILADLETPVSTFYKVCKNQPYSFLLESVEGNEKIGRYSLIGTEPIMIFTSYLDKTSLYYPQYDKTVELEKDPFVALKILLSKIKLKEDNDFIGFIGYFGFENIRWIEPKLRYTCSTKTPDVLLILPGKLIIFDHIMHKVKLISISLSDKASQDNLKSLFKDFTTKEHQKHLLINFQDQSQIKFESRFPKEKYLKIIQKAKEYIKKGDIFQVVPSQKFTVKGVFDGLLLYRALRSINPSPYLFYIRYPDFELAGSSPEVMVKCQLKNKKRIAQLRPIAGTYPRGKDENEDLKNIQTLQKDPKERAEHLMLVDLARNDLGRVCKKGSINVSELMTIEKYSHVLHMVSLTEGELEDDKTSIDLLCASFPAGTLSGAPKIKALEIIKELEKEQRGPYGGCAGFFGINDLINTCMTIRTFIVYKDHVEIQAGGGIVSDSIPENEYQETLRKGGALLKAISLVKPAEQ